MPKGPKGRKRPADVIGNAVKVMRILTGEEKEDFPADVGCPAACNEAPHEVAVFAAAAGSADAGTDKR